jgi:hypothetical protein
VTVANRDKAKSNALTKHRKAMGTSTEQQKDLTASIVDKKIAERFMPPPNAYRQHASPDSNPDLEHCNQFSSADDYANSQYNQFSNQWDDDHSRSRGGPMAARNHDKEAEIMKSRWNYYQKMGLIKPKEKSKLSRFI